MPFDSKKYNSSCVSMTRRAISGRPDLWSPHSAQTRGFGSSLAHFLRVPSRAGRSDTYGHSTNAHHVIRGVCHLEPINHPTYSAESAHVKPRSGGVCAPGPHHQVAHGLTSPFVSEDRADRGVASSRRMSGSSSFQGRADIARHVMGCHVTQGTRPTTWRASAWQILLATS